MILFDGYQFAAEQEAQLRQRLFQLKDSQAPSIAAILFTEDEGSRLYSRLKQEAARRLGMAYTLYPFSMTDPVEKIIDVVDQLNRSEACTGIIVQKPWTHLWQSVTGRPKVAFTDWWLTLVSRIDETKDVDGLHPATMASIQTGDWQQTGKVLPATARAVLAILDSAGYLQSELHYVIIGKSDLLGKPLYYELNNRKFITDLIGTKELKERIEQKKYLLDADVVISATGHQHLVTGEMVKPGVAIIDVGEPRPDVDRASVTAKAAFLTPVPGGVGPVTVVSLLANAIQLLTSRP